MLDAVAEGSTKWGAFYRKGGGNAYPDENLVRIIKGDYVDVPRSGRALDVGFGVGGNLIMLAQCGFEAHGLEVSEESLKQAEAFAAQVGIDVNLGLIEGTELPYEDGFFDLLVSWGAVYYHGSRTLVSEAIDEFHRVLRPGGALLLAALHPNCALTRRLSDDLGDGARQIDRDAPFDTRYGIKIFYDATSSGWRALLHKFREISEGYSESDIFVPERRNASRLFLAMK